VTEGRRPNDPILWAADPEGLRSMILTQPDITWPFYDMPYIFEGREIKVNKFTMNDSQSFCVPYHGDLEAVFKENSDIKQTVEHARINANTITVHAVDNINNQLYFNQRKAKITAGRAYTIDEAREGLPVCIINSNFAEFNGLNVGDRINISLYTMRINNGNLREYQFEPHRGDLSLKIVGIYSAPVWNVYRSEHAPSDATIFMPFTSIPVKAEEKALPFKVSDIENTYEQIMFANYSTHDLPRLFTVEIPNHKLSEFQQEVISNKYYVNVGGHDGTERTVTQKSIFIYSDMGYGESVGEAVAGIISSTRIFLYAAFGVFAATVMLFIVLLIMPGKRYDVGMLLSLGSSKWKVITASVLGWLISPFLAVIIAVLIIIPMIGKLITMVYRIATEHLIFNDAFSSSASVVELLNSRFEYGSGTLYTTVILCLGILLIFAIISIAVAAVTVNIPLIRLIRRRE